MPVVSNCPSVCLSERWRRSSLGGKSSLSLSGRQSLDGSAMADEMRHAKMRQTTLGRSAVGEVTGRMGNIGSR